MNELKSTPPKQIANLVLDTFEALPPRCKPRDLPNGSREWTPLSAIVLTTDHSPELKLVSLGTGTKSLPASALQKCQGLILHDCHAEILALRGLNYWILCELERIITQKDYKSPWLEVQTRTESRAGERIARPFRIRANVNIHMLSTEAPCGDASTELSIAAAKASGLDTSPWPTSQTPSSLKATPDGCTLPPGRGGFSDLGALRRKPARADAEVSMSMSCTDKLMMRQFTGLLGFPAEMFLEHNENTFLKSMIVYEDNHNATGYGRAFAKNGRLEEAISIGDRPAEVKPNFFDIEVLPPDFRRFKYERIRNTYEQSPKSKVTNTSTVWIAGDDGKKSSDVVEVLVNGVKQGYKQFDAKPRKGSVLCRFNMLQKALAISDSLQHIGWSTKISDALKNNTSYSELKNLRWRRERRAVKAWVLEKLGGWPVVTGDDFDMEPSSSRQYAARP